MLDVPKFKCNQCGKCCKDFGDLKYKEQPGFLVFLDEVWLFDKRDLIPYNRNKYNEIFSYWMSKQPCPLYRGKCEKYSSRPLTCRSYPLIMNAGDLSKPFFNFLNCNAKQDEVGHELTHESENIWSKQRLKPTFEFDSLMDDLEDCFTKYGLQAEWLACLEIYSKRIWNMTHHVIMR